MLNRTIARAWKGDQEGRRREATHTRTKHLDQARLMQAHLPEKNCLGFDPRVDTVDAQPPPPTLIDGTSGCVAGGAAIMVRNNVIRLKFFCDSSSSPSI